MDVRFSFGCDTLKVQNIYKGYIGEIGATPVETVKTLKLEGWTGTYQKCYCPECSKLKNKK